MKTWIWHVPLVALAVIGITSSAKADPMNHGRFLRDPSDSAIVYSYGSASPTAFDQNVFCGTTQCGEIKFDYDTYLKKPNGLTSGGGALSGGFYINPALRVNPADTLVWVQTVISTKSGENDWGIDPTMGGVEFPDATPANPAYPFNMTAATPPNPPGPPTLGYQDFPSRSFADGNQSWLAELGLVCIQNTPGTDGFEQAYVIDTFLWGFGVQTTPNMITANAPHLWSAPTASYLMTLNSYYSGTPPMPPTSGGVSSKINFQAGCDNCFVAVPEPSNDLAFMAALLVMAGYIRRQKKQNV